MTDGDGLRYHVDGELVPASAATVSVRDRGFAYGDAAFETLRAYGGRIFEWEAHADRLRNTCEALELDHGLSDADLRGRVRETLAANGIGDAYLRLSVTRGVQPGKLTPKPDVDPTVVVVVKPLPRGGRDSRSVWDGPASLQTVKTRRVPNESIPAAAKTHNYLNGILARLELRGPDGPTADEALLRDADGDVAEGATSNVFFVSDGALRTPSLEGPVLPGVTRRVVVELAESEGFPVEEGRYRPDDVRNADEVFLTNTTWEVRPVSTVDGVSVGDGGDGGDGDEADADGATGPMTALLARLYDERVESACYEQFSG